MEIIKNYRHNDALRASFNSLAEKIFGLNFENWYRLGYWGDDYRPYSVVEDGKVVANVSLNRTDMVIGGETRRFYQLGTVMTDPAYRSRGYIRAIMAQIEKDIAGADGVYLFANDSVLDFYPKFGFARGTEHIYSRKVTNDQNCRMVQVSMGERASREKLEKAMASSTFRAGCHMEGNPGLIFFYAAQFMADCVYYCTDLDTWAIAEPEAGVLTLHNVFGAADLDTVIAAFGREIQSVVLGFTPADPRGWDCQVLHEEDCTFFVKGHGFRDFSARRLRIPTLSHG